MTTDGADAHKAVEEAARAARGAVADLAGVPGERLDQALRAIADGLLRSSAPVLAANEEDMAAVFCAAGDVLAALTIRNPSRAKCEKTTPQEFACSLEAPPLRSLEPATAPAEVREAP